MRAIVKQAQSFAQMAFRVFVFLILIVTGLCLTICALISVSAVLFGFVVATSINIITIIYIVSAFVLAIGRVFPKWWMSLLFGPILLASSSLGAAFAVDNYVIDKTFEKTLQDP